MPIKINYNKKPSKNLSSNLILFSDNNFSTKNLKNFLNKYEINYIEDLLKISDLKKNLLVFELNSKKKYFLYQSKIVFKAQTLKTWVQNFIKV